MATYNKFNDFVEQLAKGIHQVHAAGHTFNAYLSNEAPLAADTVKTDIADLGTGGGYTAGGADTQNDLSETGGTASAVATDIVWTGSGGGFGPFRYAIIYNDTAAAPLDALVNWWDYGSSISVLASETFTLDFGATWWTLT